MHLQFHKTALYMYFLMAAQNAWLLRMFTDYLVPNILSTMFVRFPKTLKVPYSMHLSIYPLFTMIISPLICLHVDLNQ